MITDKGAILLLEFLRNNLSALSIDLSMNQIDDGFIPVLADVLNHDKTIVNIDLIGNKLTKEGGEKLVNSVRNNHTLRSVFLGNNSNMKKMSVVMIREFLEHSSVEVFEIQDNKDLKIGGIHDLLLLNRLKNGRKTIDLSYW